jgi:hypothetical protein
MRATLIDEVHWTDSSPISRLFAGSTAPLAQMKCEFNEPERKLWTLH